MINSGSREGKGVEDWQVQTIMCKITYKDILCNTGNIANIL